MPPKITG
jgi:hypothetical protein